jgi:hypothetical protein
MWEGRKAGTEAMGRAVIGWWCVLCEKGGARVCSYAPTGGRDELCGLCGDGGAEAVPGRGSLVVTGGKKRKREIYFKMVGCLDWTASVSTLQIFFARPRNFTHTHNATHIATQRLPWK